VPQIEVTFDINADGIVHVSATDRATGKAQSMTISGQSSLSKEDIARMVKDAEAHADEDKRRREEADVKNQADTMVYQTEKMLRENGDKVPGDEKTRIEAALADLKAVKDGGDIEATKRAVEQLSTASQSFAQKLYEASAAEQAASGGGAAGGPGAGEAGSSRPADDDIIDAEIVDEK
jgi:molecular chaperone DnaK